MADAYGGVVRSLVARRGRAPAMTQAVTMAASLAWLTWMTGCSGGDHGDVAMGTTTGPMATTDAVVTGETSTHGSADDSSSAGGSAGASIVHAEDLGDSTRTCEIWAQDCPSGEKCTPVEIDGLWGATQCVAIAADPRQADDACTIAGIGMWGFDDCDRGLLCWDVNRELIGNCVPLCQGTEAAPVCADPCRACSIASPGTLAVCLTTCDPLVQDCDNQGAACAPAWGAFQCLPTRADPPASVGDPCSLGNDVCAPGLVCTSAQRLPGCAAGGATGCCSPLCDTEAPDACASLLPGTHCEPWFEPGHAPGCGSLRQTGVCASVTLQ